MNEQAELAGFPIVVGLDVAWGDMDSYGHVNNVVYFRYFEAARIALLDQVGWLESKLRTGLGPILHSTAARYRRALTYPDHIRVGARPKDLQSDRVTVEYRIFSRKWNAVACEGQAIVVSYDYLGQAKVPIPEPVRQGLLQLMASGGGPFGAAAGGDLSE